MSLTKKVYEHIDRLEKENKRLEKYIDNLQVVHFTELQTEKAENARLRKALEKAVKIMQDHAIGDVQAEVDMMYFVEEWRDQNAPNPRVKGDLQ